MIPRFWLLDTGFCTASEHHMISGGARRPVRAHAVAALLEHPAKGLVLFDTGYAPRVLAAMNDFPFQVYRSLTPTTTRAEWSVVAQLERLGFKAGDVRTVVVSHLHADHIGGWLDFPEARPVLSAQALEVMPKRGFAALKHGFLPRLAPDVLTPRAEIVREFAGEALPALGATHDLFGDGLLRLVPLPGHARGQVGLHALTAHGPVLFASDGCWWSEAYRANRPPHPLPLRLFFDDAAQSVATVDRLHRYNKAQPETWIVPTHCPEVAALLEPGVPRAFP